MLGNDLVSHIDTTWVWVRVPLAWDSTAHNIKSMCLVYLKDKVQNCSIGNAMVNDLCCDLVVYIINEIKNAGMGCP